MKKDIKLLAVLATDGNNLSADTIKNLSGKLGGDLKKIYDEFWASIPKIDKFYTKLLEDINNKKRIHKQSTFGNVYDFNPEFNVCGSPMCTAGHWVNMAGTKGYELQRKYGWEGAANILHRKVYPDYPCQNFGSIPQSWAMAYIEMMAETADKGLPFEL